MPETYQQHAAKTLKAMPTSDPHLNMRVAAQQWQVKKVESASAGPPKPKAPKPQPPVLTLTDDDLAELLGFTL